MATYAARPRRVRRKYKRRYNRRMTSTNILKSRTPEMHKFNRHWQFTTISQSSAVGGVALRCYTFNLGLLPTVADFTTLFDRYMITYIKLWCYLKVTPDANTTPSAASYPRLYWATDFDDSSDPASLDELFQYQKVRSRMLSPSKPVIIKFRPACLTQIFNNLTSSQSPKWRQWIDMAQTGVPHYGIKLGVENWFSANTDIIIRGKMYFRCKDVR